MNQMPDTMITPPVRNPLTHKDASEIRDFDLAAGIMEALTGYTPAEIVTAARRGDLAELPGITKERFVKIINLLKSFGYLDVKTLQSIAIRNLFAKIGLAPEDEPTACQVSASTVFTDEQINWVINELVDTLKIAQSKVIKLRFGLDGQPALTYKECATHLRISVQRVQKIEQAALDGLQHPCRMSKIREYFHVALPTIDELDFSVRTYRLLKRANITRVDELCEMTESQLLCRGHMGRNSVEEIIDKLKKLNLKLAQEPEEA